MSKDQVLSLLIISCVTLGKLLTSLCLRQQQIIRSVIRISYYKLNPYQSYRKHTCAYQHTSKLVMGIIIETLQHSRAVTLIRLEHADAQTPSNTSWCPQNKILSTVPAQLSPCLPLHPQVLYSYPCSVDSTDPWLMCGLLSRPSLLQLKGIPSRHSSWMALSPPVLPRSFLSFGLAQDQVLGETPAHQ